MSQDLRSLAPWLRAPAQALFAYGHKIDKRLMVTSARRSWLDQQRLWHKCRNGGCELPVAPPGKSLHQQGRAFDIARRGVDPFVDDLLVHLGQLWEAAGGTWGGRFGGPDPVHFEA